MGKRSFKGDKRRRELQKKKKKEEKLQRRQNRDDSGEDNSYLEYLNPGGPMDERYLDDEDEDQESEGSSPEE